MWLPQKELTEAVEALKKIKPTTHSKSKLRVHHPVLAFTDRQWEAAICALFASHSEYADAILPENTQILYGVS